LGGPLRPNWLSQTVGDYVQKSGVRKHGACHLFRHAMATAMLENGADVRFVQAMLGHSSLQTTALYTQVAVAKLKQIHEATHPARMERRDKGTPQDLEPEQAVVE
jgi:integrase/recombinase XerD